MSKTGKGKWKKWILGILGGVSGILLLLVVIGIGVATDYTNINTPAGYPVNASYYMPMDDGSKVHYDVWLPEVLEAGEKIPAMILTSRYTTHVQPGPLYKLLMTYGGEKHINYGSVSRFTERGYAYVFIQSPGSVGSTGVRRTEYPPSEIEAMGKVIDWIVQQDWSNRKVGATGVSYNGTTADMIAATLRPNVKAVAPLYSDFDPYLHIVRPGGLYAKSFTQTWSDLVRGMDLDNLSGIVGDAWYMKYVVAGAQRPTGENESVFEQAIQEHENNDSVIDAVAALEFKDDRYGSSGYSMDDIALYAYREELEGAQVSAYYRVGWFDAGTVEGALQRLRAIHRKLCDPASAPFVPLGPYHSFKREDAMPLVPGEIAELVITMLPVSVRFAKGHRIRVAIAGYDDVIGAKHPADDVPTITVHRNSVHPSHIELPVIEGQSP